MSRRSSSDLVSLSSFLCSSSAFRLAGLRIGSQRLPFRSRTPFASGGSVLLVIVGCRLFISLHPCPKHSRLRRRGASRAEKKTSGLALTRSVNKHAQEILSIARPVRVSLIFIQRALCGPTPMPPPPNQNSCTAPFCCVWFLKKGFGKCKNRPAVIRKMRGVDES
jgi:hypothetical protein